MTTATDTAAIVAERDRQAGLRKARPYLERPLLDDESEQARAILQAHGIAYRRIRTDFATGAHTVIEEWQPPQPTERNRHMSTQQLPPDLPGWSIVTRRGQIHLSLRIDGETINTRNRDTLDAAIADARWMQTNLGLTAEIEQLELAL